MTDSRRIASGPEGGSRAGGAEAKQPASALQLVTGLVGEPLELERLAERQLGGVAGPVEPFSVPAALSLQRLIGNRALTDLHGARLPATDRRVSRQQRPVKPVGNEAAAQLQRTAKSGASLHVAAGGTCCGGVPGLQRHASDEHLALGELDPKKLGGIADARDLYRDLSKQSSGAFTLDDQNDPKGVIRDTIHLLQAERKRVRDWQHEGPTKSGVTDGVRVVSIKTSDGQVFGTYGELNTLPDYFGNTTDLHALSSQHMVEVLQTLRQEYYDWLGKFLLELTERDYQVREESIIIDGNVETFEVPYYKGEPLEGPGGEDSGYTSGQSSRLQGQNFKGSQTGLSLRDIRHPIAGISSSVGGMKGASVPVDIDEGVQARKTGGAWGSLARNACHFVPFSWDSWKQYHIKALRLADEAYDLRQQKAKLEKELADSKDDKAKGDLTKQIEKKEQEAQQKEDEAFVQNGFGDHYLQDSFAAGHLMNKTLVMQWFMEYIDKNWKVTGPSTGGPWERLMTMSSEAQPKMSGQSLYSKNTDLSSPDPQTVANVGEERGRKAEFEQSGLQVPDLSDKDQANELVGNWMVSSSRESWLSVDKVKAFVKGNNEGIPGLLDELVSAGLVVKGRSPTQFMKMTYKLNLASGVLSNLKDKEKNKKLGPVSNPLETMMMGNYEEWLYSSTVQMGSKVMHDYFCKHGLEVYDDEHEDVYKIYGDYELLAQGAAKGVRFASQTSHISQQDIESRVRGGPSNGDRIGEVYARFPRYAVVPDSIQSGNTSIKLPDSGKKLKLEQWLTDLKPHLMNLFGTTLTNTEIYGSRTVAKSPTSSGTLLPHEGEPF